MKTMKTHYERISIELITFCSQDIITASYGAFDGEDDDLTESGKKLSIA